MHFVLSLFCDGRVVEIFILRLVHLESGIDHDGSCFLLFRLGLLNHLWEWPLLGFFVFLMKGLLSAYICRCNHVESRPIGVVEFGVVDGC